MADLETVVYKLQADVSDIRKAFDDFRRQSDQTNRSVANLADTLRGRLTTATNLFGAALAGIGFTGGVFGVVQLSDKFRLLEAQMRLAGVATDQVSGNFRVLLDNAQQLGVNAEGTIDLFNKLTRSTRELGISNDELLKVVTNINKAVVASGASAADAAGGLFQLGQAFQKGKLNGDEFNVIAERLPIVLEVVRAETKRLGLDFEELKGSIGITGQLIAQAFVNAGPELDRQIGEIPETIDRALERARTSFFRGVGEFTKKGLFDPLILQITEIANIFERPEFQQGVANIAEDLTGLVKFITENIDTIEKFGLIIGGALLGGRLGGKPGAIFGAIVGADKAFEENFQRNQFERNERILEQGGPLIGSRANLIARQEELRKSLGFLTEDQRKATSTTGLLTEEEKKLAAASAETARIFDLETEKAKEQRAERFEALQDLKQEVKDVQEQIEAFKAGGDVALEATKRRQQLEAKARPEVVLSPEENTPELDAKLTAEINEQSAAFAQLEQTLDDIRDARQKAAQAAEDQKQKEEAARKKVEEERQQRENSLAAIRQEIQDKVRLFIASEKGLEQFEEAKRLIDAETEARRLKFDLQSDEGKLIVEEITRRGNLNEAIDENVKKLLEEKEARDRLKENTEDLKIEEDNQRRLQEALNISLDQFKEVQAQINREKELRRLGIKVIGDQERAYLKLAASVDAGSIAIGRQEQLIEDQQRQAQEIFEEPFKNAIRNLQSEFAAFFNRILETGRITFAELGEGIRGLVNQAISQTLSAALLNPGQVSSQLGKLQDLFFNGGIDRSTGLPVFGSNLGNGIAGGTIGVGIGTTFTAATGGNTTASALVGTGGAVAGGIIGSFIPGVGTAIGAAVGGALGGVLGGLFGGGGGENNDGFGFRFDPRTGRREATDREGSAQNRAASARLVDEALRAVDVLKVVGLDIASDFVSFKQGNNSGTEFRNQQFDTPEAALQAAIRLFINDAGNKPGGTLRTVLENTEAKTAQELQADIRFARVFDQLTKETTEFSDQVFILKEQFGEARLQAEKLGLDLDKLTEAEKRRIDELAEQTLFDTENQLKQQADQIRNFFRSITEPFDQALGAFGLSFGVAAPQASFSRALKEFRELRQRAVTGDQDAISQLPGFGTQLAQFAREAFASGTKSADVIREIEAALKEVRNLQNDKMLEALQGIDAAIRFTADDQVRVLRRGFDQLAEKLDLLRLEVGQTR